MFEAIADIQELGQVKSHRANCPEEVLEDLMSTTGIVPAVNQVEWHSGVQSGAVAIPESAHRERLLENLSINKITLSIDEISSLTAMDHGGGSGRIYTDPRNFPG